MAGLDEWLTSSRISVSVSNSRPTRKSQICTPDPSHWLLPILGDLSAFPHIGSLKSGHRWDLPFFHYEVSPRLCLPLRLLQMQVTAGWLVPQLQQALHQQPFLFSFGWRFFPWGGKTGSVIVIRNVQVHQKIQLSKLIHRALCFPSAFCRRCYCRSSAHQHLWSREDVLPRSACPSRLAYPPPCPAPGGLRFASWCHLIENNIQQNDCFWK